MNKEKVFDKLKSITNLPTLPAVMHKLNEAVSNPDINADKIANIIKDDPSMMTRILKVINSASYGLSEPVHSVQQALALMGMLAVKNIALSTAVFSSYSGDTGSSSFSREEFWHHCVSVGIALKVLYEKTRENLGTRFTSDILQLSGLLHDIGKIVLEQYFHDEFMSAIDLGREREIPLYQAESEVLGVNHTEVGEWLGRRWKLQQNIIQVIRWHHEPEHCDPQFVELLRLCHTANHVCNIENIGNGGDEFPFFMIGVWKRIGFRVRDIASIVDQIEEESKESETLLALMKA